MAKRTRQKKDYTPQCDAELDLHGHTALEAEEAVLLFLEEANEEGWGRVRIIVGKGTRSEIGPVLPDLVKRILAEQGLSYTYAKLQHGGEGALEVSLS